MHVKNWMQKQDQLNLKRKHKMRKIKQAVLHGNINVPGVSSNVDKTLKAGSGALNNAIRSLTITLGATTLDCVFNGTVEVGIPLTNVQSFVYEPEEVKPKLVADKK